ncbi:hypothetical protein CCR75_002608 [Bremia lactucae]|uniref:RxLR effector protein n=1 Tax=Bremia lactucae TaxID=4779 RepID=A0A976ILF8_BRELC|nr:hypothetical protein CCR75_002608 [Bremia lactucae]
MFTIVFFLAVAFAEVASSNSNADANSGPQAKELTPVLSSPTPWAMDNMHAFRGAYDNTPVLEEREATIPRQGIEKTAKVVEESTSFLKVLKNILLWPFQKTRSTFKLWRFKRWMKNENEFQADVIKATDTHTRYLACNIMPERWHQLMSEEKAIPQKNPFFHRGFTPESFYVYSKKLVGISVPSHHTVVRKSIDKTIRKMEPDLQNVVKERLERFESMFLDEHIPVVELVPYMTPVTVKYVVEKTAEAQNFEEVLFAHDKSKWLEHRILKRFIEFNKLYETRVESILYPLPK